jgi:thioredoxin reductase (NADPH)
MDMYDLVIVGAGPAGLSCAIAAQRAHLNVLLCDKGNVVESIINFPVDMTFFSTADVLSLANIPFNSINIRPKRSESVKYYQNLVTYFNLPVRTHSTVTEVIRNDEKCVVVFENNGHNKRIEADNVVIATGYNDNPNLLNIPGENLPHVSHYYTEPYKYFKKKVVVVSGKNSAVETALDLYRHGAEVTIVHRHERIQESVKY